MRISRLEVADIHSALSSTRRLTHALFLSTTALLAVTRQPSTSGVSAELYRERTSVSQSIQSKYHYSLSSAYLP